MRTSIIEEGLEVYRMQIVQKFNKIIICNIKYKIFFLNHCRRHNKTDMATKYSSKECMHLRRIGQHIA